MTIRQAGEADIDAVVALVNGAYRGESARAGWTHEADLLDGQRTDAALIRMLVAADPGAILLLYDAKGDLAGCVAIEPTHRPATWSLGMLTVAPPLQAHGVGRRLMAAAEGFAAARGGRIMTMTVIATRVALIAYYERRGYRLTGKCAPFPYWNERFGRPKQADLAFVVMTKRLADEA